MRALVLAAALRLMFECVEVLNCHPHPSSYGLWVPPPPPHRAYWVPPGSAFRQHCCQLTFKGQPMAACLFWYPVLKNRGTFCILPANCASVHPPPPPAPAMHPYRAVHCIECSTAAN